MHSTLMLAAEDLAQRLSVGDGNFGDRIGTSGGLLVMLLGLDVVAMAFVVGALLALRAGGVPGRWVPRMTLFGALVGVAGLAWAALLPHDFESPDQLWWIAGFHGVLVVVGLVLAALSARRRQDQPAHAR